jgi:hypothetical protein
MTTDPSPKMQCRYLKSSGHPCRGLALRGQPYCFSHGRDLRRYANTSCSPARIHIPRLDNRDDIQQVLTDLARAIAAETIDHHLARLLMSVVRLASRQLPPPRDLDAHPRDKEEARVQPEPVEEVFRGPNGEDLAPETPYQGAHDKPERKWSFAEYLYHKAYPGNEDKPLPEEGYGNSLATVTELTTQQPAPLEASKPEESKLDQEDQPTLILDNIKAAAQTQQYRSTTPANHHKRRRIHQPPQDICHPRVPHVSILRRGIPTGPGRATPFTRHQIVIPSEVKRSRGTCCFYRLQRIRFPNPEPSFRAKSSRP